MGLSETCTFSRPSLPDKILTGGDTKELRRQDKIPEFMPTVVIV